MAVSTAAPESPIRRTTARTVRIDDELWESLEALAGPMRRSRSNLLNVALEEYVQRHAESEAA